MHESPETSPDENGGSNGHESSMMFVATATTTEGEFEGSSGSGRAGGDEEEFVHDDGRVVYYLGSGEQQLNYLIDQ